MNTPPCYCDQALRDHATGQQRFLCNVCANAVVDEKNRLVRQEQDFPARLAAEYERGRADGACSMTYPPAAPWETPAKPSLLEDIKAVTKAAEGILTRPLT